MAVAVVAANSRYKNLIKFTLMATQAQQFPGMEELIKHLKDQKVAEKGNSIMTGQKPTNFTPTSTSAANAAKVAKGGVFRGGLGAAAGNATTRAGMGALRALSGAGPVGAGITVLAAGAPVAYQVGENIGEAYRSTAMEDAYKEGNPYTAKFAAEARANGRPAVGDQPMDAGMMPQITARQERVNPNSMEYVDLPPDAVQEITVPGLHGDMNAEATEMVPDSEGADDPQPGMEVQAQDPQLEQIMQLLQAPERTPPMEEIDPNQAETVARLSKNEAPPRRKIGGWERFWAAGSGGPVDFTRADRREEELYQLRNKMTDRDRFAGGYATGDIADTKNFNRGLVSQNFKEGGMSPQMKFMADLLAGDRRGDRTEASQSRLSSQEAGQTMARDKAGVKATSESPDQLRLKSGLKFMMDNPDFFEPEQLRAVFGVQPKQAGLDAALKARGKGNEVQQMIAAMVLQSLKDRQGVRGGSQPAAQPEKKSEPKKGEGALNLQSLTR